MMMRAVCGAWWLVACAPAPGELACPVGTTPRRVGDELACTRADGLRHGPARAWFADGTLRVTGGYVDDQPDGPWIWWRANGRKQAEGQMRAGVLVGPYRAWHDNGQLYLADTYVDGKPEGEATRYHANGQRAAHGELRDGRKHGVWTFWHPSGAREREGRYDRGKQVGTWARWDAAGAPMSAAGAAP
jgi:antitoxin component YwqK of YwqJK toxin-antitoxin module